MAYTRHLEALREVDATATRRGLSLQQFLESEVETDYGRWSLAEHEPLGEIVSLIDHIVSRRETDAKLTIIKGEQIGVTTVFTGAAVWAPVEHGLNTGYFLPDDDFASEWGMSKINPIVDGSEFLTRLMKDAKVDRGVLKAFGDKHLYLLGLNKLKGATSRPMDIQISDEVDLTSEKIRKWKRGRMRHSRLRFEMDFSAPYAQNSGIDARYQKGSQRRWLVSCAACGASDICLEESFPECMRNFEGTWLRVCPQCKEKLDIVSSGQWVATYPDRETDDRHYSFRISALSIAAIEGNAIMSVYNDAVESGDPDEMAIVNRTIRGFADAGSMQPIDDAVLRRMAQGHDYVLSTDQTSHPIFFGVDVGNSCWAWFEEWLPEGRARLVWAEKIHSDRWVARIFELIRQLRPRFGVVDMMPLFSDAREIAYAHPEHVALQQFESGKELYFKETCIVDEDAIGGAHVDQEFARKFWLVKGDRNLLLDQWCKEATHVDRGLILPNERSRTMDFVCEHLKKLQKIKDRDARGNEIHRFLDGVENHFGMAAASARIARLVAPNIQPFVFTAIPRASRRDRFRVLEGGADELTTRISRREQFALVA